MKGKGDTFYLGQHNDRQNELVLASRWLQFAYLIYTANIKIRSTQDFFYRNFGTTVEIEDVSHQPSPRIATLGGDSGGDVVVVLLLLPLLLLPPLV